MQYALKKCSRCKEEKSRSEYNKDKQKRDGLRHECKSCQSKQTAIDTERRRNKLRYHKFKGIYSGLTAVAKKIYEVTPIAVAWNAHQIKDELTRTSTPTESRIILGCLNTLTDAGLVKEAPAGFFRRITVIGKPEKHTSEFDLEITDIDEQVPETKQEINMKPTNAIEKTIVDPIEKIGQLAQQCQEIMEAVQKLASNIETVAIEVQESFSARDGEVQKLKQLQQLLKSLG